MTRPLTVGSLFSGIGMFDLGFERAGCEIRWQVEIDPFCRAVLAKHWPGVTRYADICTLHAPEPAWVDILCGGFPCQDISDAGTRLGLAGSRSGLWREFRRLIGELRPRFVVVENTAALLHPGRGMGVVLGDLAALGYDAEWDCLPLAAFGAPHLRDRVLLVAYPDTWGSAQRIARQPIAESGREHSADALDDGPPSADAPRERRDETGRALRQRYADVDGDVAAVADVDGAGRDRPRLPQAGPGADHAVPGGHGPDAADAAAPGPPRIFGERARTALTGFRRTERGRWWDVEPALVRVVHGGAARLVRRRDRHVQQIGALGNAVSPILTEWIAQRILAADAQMTR